MKAGQWDNVSSCTIHLHTIHANMCNFRASSRSSFVMYQFQSPRRAKSSSKSSLPHYGSSINYLANLTCSRL